MDYLGQDEIILITCDDGDVVGYRTEEIQRVLDERKENSVDGGHMQIEDHVRTFLHRNVGASAWGLAVHREARMIAISANTHKVTVIAYALAQLNDYSDSPSGSSGSELEDCSDEENSVDFPSPRRQNHVITLAARQNIPSVSFNNSGDDPSGRWLTSCSINGETLIWDLHNPEKPVRTIRLGFCASVKDPTKAPQHAPGSCACLRPSNFPHAVWNTMFLDAGTAYEDPSIEDLIPSSNHPLPYIQDVSGCKDRFTIKSCKVPPPAMVVSPDVDIPGEASSEMDVSEPESSDFDESAVQLSPSSENIGVEQPSQLDNHDVVSSVLTEGADAHQLPQVPNQSSQSTIDTLSTTEGVSTGIASSVNGTIASPALPPQLSSNAINAFGVWFQPPQGTATIVWDDDDDSGTDDELFIPSTAQAHMAFANAIRPNRAYCEVTTAFTLARQVRNCQLVTRLLPNQGNSRRLLRPS